MNILSRLGFSNETIQLIEPHCNTEKGKVIFPFFCLDENVACSSEIIYINKSYRNSDKGLLIIENEPDTLKTQMFVFDNLFNMMCYYDKSNRFLFENAVFVVIPIRPDFIQISSLLDKFKHIQKYTLVFNNDLAGHCKEVLMTSYLSKIDNVKIMLEGEDLNIKVNEKESNYPLTKFKFKQFLSFYNFPIKVQSIKPKGFNP